MGWSSVGIRLVLIAALCLFWLNSENVNGNPTAEEHIRPAEDPIGDLARTILDQLYLKRHQPYIDELRKRLNEPKLSNDEELLKNAIPDKKFRDELPNEKLRQTMIDHIPTEVDYQTIAVGVDSKSRKVVVAGNIKTFNFWDVKVKLKTDKETKKKQLSIAGVKIKDAGFQVDDFPIIKGILAENYPEHEIVVISPSAEDLKKLRTPGMKDVDQLRAEAQTYHAEMQIKNYFEKNGDFSLDGKKIVASKQYCVKCLANLPEDVKEVVNGDSYGGTRMRWETPDEVEVHDLGVTPKASEIAEPSEQELVERLQQSGGACGGHGSRRRRSLCSSFEDFTEIDADEFHQKIQEMPEGERKQILNALDKVGMEKLQGSDSAVKTVDYNWKKWKSSVANEVMGAVNEGTILFDLVRRGSRSFELEKIAISPKILSESLNNLQEKDLNELAEQYEKFRKGEMEEPKSFKGLGFSYKFVKTLNLGMFGKNLIGGVLNGDPDSVIAMVGLFAADRGLGKAGELIAAKGVRMVQAGSKVIGTTLKIAGPIVGSATLGFTIYSFVGDINQLKYLEKFCQRNDSLFQDRLKKDCNFDMDITIANTVGDGVGIVSGVVLTVEAILALLSVETGPIGIVFAVIDVLVVIGTQIYAAVETVAKISSSIVGGLSGWETFRTGFRSFFGMSAPSDIQDLLDIKKSYDASVYIAVGILKNATKFQTYIYPTNHTLNGKSDFEEDSEANFQDSQHLHRFRVEPDTPSWGQLECNPNSLASQSYPRDPEYAGEQDGLLCHNVIAMTAANRSDLPVLVDLKNGTDEIVGFKDRKHVFLVEQGTKTFTGGSADDMFVMKSFPFNGRLDGAEGRNTLFLLNDEASRFNANLSGACPNCDYKLTNIQQIVGRSNKADTVVTDCCATYIDLSGGESASNPDELTIPSSDCQTSPNFQLREFTNVENSHESNGNFIYQVELASNIQVKVNNPEKNVHRFIFPHDIITTDLTMESGTLTMTNKTEGKELFKSNFIMSNNFTLMTQLGLSINYDDSLKSFYGVAYPSNGTQNLTGFVNYPNRFILDTNVTVNVTGGDKDDIFSFSGTHKINGSIGGSPGEDSIVLQQDFHPDRVTIIDFTTKVLSPGDVPLSNNISDSLETNAPSGSTGESYGEMQFSNIKNVIGRRALAEDVKVNCDVKWLDLRGGTDIQSDLVQLSSDLSCKSEMTITVSNFTIVANSAAGGDFHYLIDVEGSTQTNFVRVNMDSNATHKYIFQKNSTSVSEIAFNQTSKELKIQFQDAPWSGIISKERSKVYLADQIAVEFLPEVQGVVQVESNSTFNVTGLPTYHNTFVLGMATNDSSCTGGGKDDAFFIASEKFYGKISGGDGNNSIILMNEIWNGRPIIVDGVNNTVSVKKGNETEYQIGFSGIQRFFGRVGQSDVFFPGCDTKLIDTRGVSNGSTYDLIFIPYSSDCSFALDMAIRPNLVVINDAEDGEFGYEGDFRGGNTSIFLTFREATDHSVILAMDFLELEHLKIEQGRVNMTAADNSAFSIDFFIPMGNQVQTQPTIVFQDGLQLKISDQGNYGSSVFGILRNVSSSDLEELKENIETSGLIERYRKTARDTRTSVFMQVEEGTMISIGYGGGIDVITAVPGYAHNILVCNDANETVYRIANGTSKVQILARPQSKGPKVLDLTPIVRDDHTIVPTVEQVGVDVVFKIKDVEITMKRLSDRTYSDLKSWQVLLRETYLNFEEDMEFTLKLVPHSIVVEPNQHDTVVVNTVNLEHDMRILTNIDASISYERVKQGNSLVFTNLFRKDMTTKVATVVFHEFYNENVTNTLEGKNVIFEVKPGDFIHLNQATGDNLPTFEQRESEMSQGSDHLLWTTPTSSKPHVVDEL